MAALLGVASAFTLSEHIEIAPDVWMPRLNLNAYPNSSSWLSAGGRGMDCALDYGDEQQHEMGHAAHTSGVPRSELFITTKVPCCPKPSGFVHTGGIWPFLPAPNCQHTARNTTADIQYDLQVIGVEYVDLMLLHFSCDRWEDTMTAWRALEEAALTGTARAIGVSNFNQTDIEKLVASARIPPAVNQAGFAIGSPQNATLGRDWATIRRCQQLGVTYEAYAPFGERHASAPTSRVNVLDDRTVKQVAARHNRSTALVALRWILQHGMAVVTGSANPQHQRGDLDVFAFNLTAADMVELDAVR